MDEDDLIPVRQEAVDERAQAFNDALGISELDYPQMLARAIVHAKQPRPNPATPDPPWMCVGPRNVGGRIISLAQDPENPLTLYAGSAHGGLWRTLDGGDSWSHVGPPEFNFPVGAIAIHPARRTVLYVGTGSQKNTYVAGTGIYRVRLPDPSIADPRGAVTFEQLAPAPAAHVPPSAPDLNGSALRYTRIEVDRDDPDRFWAASQTGLWRCNVRAGVPGVWTRDFPPDPAAPAPAFPIPALEVGPLAAPGDTWRNYVTDLRVARENRHPRATETVVQGGRTIPRYAVLYVGIEGAGVFRGSYDRSLGDAAGAVTWERHLTVPDPPLGNDFGRVLLALCRRQPAHLYAVFANSPGTGQPEQDNASFVYYSSDNGHAWTQRGRIPRAFLWEDMPPPPAGGTPQPGQADYSMVLEVDPDNPQVLVCGEIDLNKSEDGGRTWIPILQWQTYDDGDYAQHADQHVAIFDNGDRRKLWCGNDGGISVASDLSADAGAPGFWRKRSHGILAGQFQDVTVHPTLPFMSGGGLQDNGTWVSYGGQTWYHIGGGDGAMMAIDAGDPRRYIVGVQNQMRLSFIDAGPSGWLENPVVHDVPAPRNSMFIVQDVSALSNGPFVPKVEQDPLVPGQVLLGWQFQAAAPQIAHWMAAPVGNLVGVDTAIVLPNAPPESGEAATAVAFATPVGGSVEGWIGSSRGRLFTTANAPAGTVANPWMEVMPLPAPGGPIREITRIAVHPSDARMVAVASIPTGLWVRVLIVAGGAVGVAATFQTQFFRNGAWGGAVGPTPTSATWIAVPQSLLVIAFPDAGYLPNMEWWVSPNGVVLPQAGPPAAGSLTAASTFESPITIRISAGPPNTQFIWQIGGMTVGAPTNVAPVVALPGSEVTVAFLGGPFAVGNTWTIAPNDVVTAGGGAAAGNLDVLSRAHGRVHLSYDRGATWTDISVPVARPAVGFGPSSDSLPPCPVTSLKFDVAAAGILAPAPGPLSLYAGTLVGVFVARNLPHPPAAPGPAPALAVVWRPFNGTPDNALPLTLVNDIELVPGTHRLRIATFGRGIWDCDLDGSRPQYRLYIRQTLIEDGAANMRAVLPALPPALPPAIADDPRLPAGAIALDHTHAFDIRVDAAPMKFFDDRVDGVEFDEEIPADRLVPLVRNAVYVQVHNRGFDPVPNVTVHLYYRSSPDAPLGAVAVPVPALAPPAEFYNPPNFDPAAGATWQRVGPPAPIAEVRPYEPFVVRFEWEPPAALAGNSVALLAICTAAVDPLPPLPLVPASIADLVQRERRAALRIVRVDDVPPARIFVRDGVDDDSRLGGVVLLGRSPDIVVVQAAVVDPVVAFRDLADTRPLDRVKGGASNEVYVRVQNRGVQAATAEVQIWAVKFDATQAPGFAPNTWIRLSPAPASPQLQAPVPAGGSAFVHVPWPNPADPNPADTIKAYAVVAIVRSADNTDPLPDVARVTSLETFWDYFGDFFDSDNAALRVLRFEP